MDNLVLVAATYPDEATATSDYEALKAAEKEGDFSVIGAVVMSRSAAGDVEVKEHGAGPVGAGTVLGAAGGIVVGLFAPPLLLATAVGAGLGAGIGKLVKRHEEKEIGADLEEVMPPGTSAVIAVVNDDYADRVEHALEHAVKKINKAVDKGDYEELVQEIDKQAGKVQDALDS